MIDKLDLGIASATAFGELMDEHGLRLLEIEDDSYGAYARLSNGIVEFRVHCDAADERVFVSMYRLDRGQIKAISDMEERLRDPLNGFDLDDLIGLRCPELRPVQRSSSAQGVEATLRDYASLIPRMASDVLKGDFRAFDELSRVVAHRVQLRVNAGEPVGPDGMAILNAAKRAKLI